MLPEKQVFDPIYNNLRRVEVVTGEVEARIANRLGPRRRRQMEKARHDASDAGRSIASVGGYLALAFMALSFLTPRVDHPSNDMAIGGAVWAGIAFGLAVGGVRFGKGGGRLAAQVALEHHALGTSPLVLASLTRVA
jgi:hypothetical protein